MNITVTLGELNNKDWGKACDVLGLEYYCLREGSSVDDEIILTKNQAIKLGFMNGKIEKESLNKQPIDDIDWEGVKQIAVNYMKYCESDEYHEDNDRDQYIVETVMETVFGEDIYDYLNKLNN